MTLTTETLNLWRNNAEITAGETADDDPEHIAAKAILALTAELLAIREAQPVLCIDMDSDFIKHIQKCSEDVAKWPEWKHRGADVTKFTAPAAPAAPEEIRHTIEGLLSAEIAKYPNSISVPDDLVSLAAYVAGVTK